ncbi:hypothetical protein ACFQH6_09710 [Halobacteriaceae archaeon GCM10025711]
MSTVGRRLLSDARAQSEVLGFALIISITVIGTVAIVIAGSAALDDSRHTSQVKSAEQAMTQLDSKSSLVALGASESQQVHMAFGSGTAARVEEDTGWMNVTIRNESDPDEVETRVVNKTLGSVVYEKEDTTIAYEGGGVWKKSSGGAEMVSPPEFHYRGTTLTLPLVTVSGSDRIHDRAVIRKASATRPYYPVLNLTKYPYVPEQRFNPVDEGLIVVQVHSDYYQAWGRFFEQRTGGEASYDHDAEIVTLNLTGSGANRKVTEGLISMTSGDELMIDNKAYVDSYNSSSGDYAATQSDNGTVVTSGAVTLKNQGEVHGTLQSAGVVSLASPNTRVTGDVRYGSLGATDGTVEGNIYPNGTAPHVYPAESLINSKQAAITAASSDSSSAITVGNEFASDSTLDLDTGSYYLDSFHLDHQKLNIDTTSGVVEIVVANDVSMKSSNITVTGDHAVRIFVAGGQAEIKDSEVNVPGQRASQFWLYGLPGITVEFDTGSHFDGIVFAPDTRASSGSITLDSQSHVYGAVVGHVTGMSQTSAIHFDEAVRNADPFLGQKLPRVTYLHVTVNAVNVSA